MFGLKEVAILAYDQLKAHLAKYRYVPMEHTPSLWHHKSHLITFTLAVDDFGIKHFNKSNAEHLFEVLCDKYSITVDWSRSSYLGHTHE